MSRKENKAVPVGIRMEQGLWESISKFADAQKISVAEWIRRACIKVIEIEESNSVCMEIEELKQIIRDTIRESLQNEEFVREVFPNYSPKK